MNKYIDVRGPYPVYIHGFIAIELRFGWRGMTIEDAEMLINLGPAEIIPFPE